MIERYTLPEMGALWTDEAKFGTWLEVEVEAALAMARHKVIPAKAAKVIEKKAAFDVDRINEIEAEVNHDVIAFLTSVSEFVGQEAKYLHFGMTSSDMLDTALSLTLKRASALIDKKIAQALKLIKALSLKFRKTPCIGRTHGVLAEPTSVGLKFAVWYTELSRRRLAFKAAADGVAVGMISGAVGNFANVDPKIEADLCRRLKLRPAEVSTQVIQRDRHAEYLTSLALLGSSLEKFATEIRNLQRTEIGEMAEGFTKGQKGSSAMPHKKNPITAERITGIARLLRGYALSAMENVPLWHERDIAHSSVERVILPDATIISDYGLQKFVDLLQGLVVDKKRMLENVYYGGGLVFSQRLLLKLTGPVGSRDKAYRMVQRHAMAAAEGHGLFRENVENDSEISKYLSKDDIDNCFELEHYMRNVDAIFKRVFGR
ncbi:MAG: adenylosuccinate lyase [candidate division Zixibacteria bacterium]|nr:adenylosuccinate lyase [candidate division Zixibacteria bacterium]MDH3938446.1 adenylosuccinate lyase [candidate division Zixibacteria bacterium]MDH4034463.1 adenylosuccinate lyase [candidate division Zixibacteria bacterium]